MLSIIRSLAAVCLALTLLGTVRASNARAISGGLNDQALGVAFADLPDGWSMAPADRYTPGSITLVNADDIRLSVQPLGLSDTTNEAAAASEEARQLTVGLAIPTTSTIITMGSIPGVMLQGMPGPSNVQIVVAHGGALYDIVAFGSAKLQPDQVQALSSLQFIPRKGTFPSANPMAPRSAQQQRSMPSPIQHNAMTTAGNVPSNVNMYPFWGNPVNAGGGSHDGDLATTNGGNFYGQGDHVHQDYYAIDWPLYAGNTVYAQSKGVVMHAGWTEGSFYGYGIWVVVSYGSGFYGYYAHMSDVSVVPGQTVTVNTLLGHSGCTGNCNGAHVHVAWVQNPLLDAFGQPYNGAAEPQTPLYTFDPANPVYTALYAGEIVHGYSVSSTSRGTPQPIVTSTPRPTSTYTPRPTSTYTPRPTSTYTPRPTSTSAPRPTSTPRLTNTPAATATRLPTLTPRPTYTPVPTNTPTIPAPGTWTFCATEGGTCSFSGTQAVAFGANGHFAYGVFTGGAPCNTSFGNPAPGTPKACYTSTTLTPPAPGIWTPCAGEGGTCSFSGTQAVAFGANGHFAYGVYTGSALCNTGFGDPAPGASKSCYTSTTLTPPAPGAWTFCSTEGGTCSFSGTQSVAFGADGHFAYGVFTGSALCNTGFGDPAPGASKGCYTSTILTPPAPGIWTPCATEGGNCGFSGTRAVAFGVNGHFAYGVFTGGAPCNTSFGNPAPGTPKACYTSTTLTPPAPGIWTPCAGEGGTCSFSGTQAVAFGANGHFAYGVYTGSALCNTGFGDPAPGASKSCYTSTTLTPPAPGAWTFCSTEGGTCSFSGTQSVAFGADGHFAYGVFTGSALCNTGFGDPAPGASKGCYTSTTLTPPAPGAWTLCATEGGNCGFSGTQAVAFGADGHFAYGVYTGGAPCNTGFGDPAPGTSKNCYTSTTLTPPAPGIWTPCATEGGTCSFSGTQSVAFGADGHFAYGVYTGGASCNTGFGDPAPGTPKACYTSTTLPPAPTPTAGPTQSALAINSGGGAAGNFVADTDVTGGTTIYSTSNTIDTSGVTNPAPQAVYQTERSGSDFTYTIPALRPNASYLVRLHFAEFAFNGPGIRLFNVTINGQQVLTNFDIYAAAGGQNKAVVEPFLATADGSGAITIEYVNVAGGAKSSGIEVLSAPPLAINSGGGAVGRFVGDTDVTGGTTMYSTTNAIDTSGVTNPAPQAVYQTERSGNNFTYTIPGLNPGTPYTVRLHFAEWAFSSPGVRLFNVTINDQQVLTNFDIYATAGGQNKAVVEQFTTTANSSGQIVITYINVSGGAKSSGIEILPAS